MNFTDYKSELTNCEREPIHIPGSIQPFGILFCVEEPSLKIRQVSVNIKNELGYEPEALLGKSLLTLMSDLDEKLLYDIFEKNQLKLYSPYQLHLQDGWGKEQIWDGFFHRHEGRMILEIEKGTPTQPLFKNFYQSVKNSIWEIQNAKSLAELCDIAAKEVQRLSGYDRVMIYRFDEEWNGKVAAEARSGSTIESYMGHHFPASDIPPQARAVFLSNWIRMIPDSSYSPVPLFPVNHPGDGNPLDLGRAFLRSVSPIHAQYLRNMNVGASLTISLIHDEKLWGLIACHHGLPKLVSHDVRTACKFIGRLTSSQLGLKEEVEDLERKRSIRLVYHALLEFMNQEDDIISGLTNYSPNLLDLLGAQGAAAAIYLEGQWKLVGNTPDKDQIQTLAKWLVTQEQKDGLFYTDCLPEIFPPALDFKDKAAGLLAITIPKSEGNFIFWFRPEVLHSVTWAGNPSKNIERLPDGTLKIEPRASFEAWKETVRNHSLPWRKVEVEAASELRNTIVALDLQRQFNREQKARAEAERAAREKEELLAAVSHDLRTPLTSIDLTLDLLERKKRGSEELKVDSQQMLSEFTRAHEKIRGSTQKMRKLIHDLLDISKIEGGGLAIDPKPTSVQHLLAEAVELVEPLAQQKGIELQLPKLEKKHVVLADEDRIMQVLSNLLSNAIKFTPAGGKISMGIRNGGNDVLFYVQDNGPGIPASNLPHVFDRFWQGKQTTRSGAGLGLAIAKGIVEIHKGKIAVESEPGKGTTVSFTLQACS